MTVIYFPGVRSWKVLSWPEEPASTKRLAYMCLGCLEESWLPVNAADLVIAQLHQGLVTDSAPSSNLMPDSVECPHCRRKLERDET